MKIFGSISELVSAIFRKDTKQITLQPSQSTTYTADRAIQFPPGDTAHVLVSATSTQTLTNKTLTSPAITTPTGIVKGDVGLGNVDNTSDATKNSATVTLTNKTLTSPVINSPTGITKSDVGLSNVDNTSDATKNAASVTLTNKTLTSPVINSPTGIVKGDVGLGNVDNTSDATKNAAAVTLTNKTINGADYDFSEYNTQGSDPSAPAGSGDVRVYAKTKFLYTIDSDGVVTQVGAGSGGRNYLSQDFFGNSVGTVGSANVTDIGNRSTGTMTAWQSTNTANISISSSATTPLRETGSFLTTGSSSNASGTTFVESKGFNLDNVDLGKAVVISFDISGSTLGTDWDVCVVRYNSSGTYQEKIPIVGTASTGTPASAQLPTGTTTFKGFFVASSTQTDYYAVRWRRLANSINVRLDSLFVGPQSLAAAQSVTDWLGYTPSLTNGTNAVKDFVNYRRVGDTMEIVGRYTWSGTGDVGSFTVALPAGFTIDTAKQSSNTTTSEYGDGTYTVSVGTLTTAIAVVYASTTTVVFRKATAVNATVNTAASGDALAFSCALPIVNWSSNATSADRAVEEYASNSNTTDASDTTSFAYGPGGSQFPTTSTNRDKTVQFTTPIQQTDRLFIEVSSNSGVTWLPLEHSDGFVELHSQQNTTNYGMGFELGATPSIQVTVRFWQYRNATGATFGAAGATFTSISASSTYKWRIRKVSGGAVVGFPVGTANVIGRTDGASSSAGYIGEVQTQSRLFASRTAATNGVALNVTATALTLQPGRWKLNGAVGIHGASGTNSISFSNPAISATSAALPGAATYGTQNASGEISMIDQTTTRTLGTGSDLTHAIPDSYISISTATTFYLVTRVDWGGGGTIEVWGSISALRVG